MIVIDCEGIMLKMTCQFSYITSLLFLVLAASSVTAQNPIASQSATVDQSSAGTYQTTADQQAADGTISQVVNNPDGTQVTIKKYYCPQPSKLIKNGLYWGTATGGWKSYSESFDTTITSFLGAQWVGVNVGKMICIYKGNLAISFPITLQNDILSQVPSGDLWGKDQGGYRNCHSTNMTDCPFVVKTQAVNMQQIYKSLDFFKGKPDILQQDNNQ